MASEGSSPPAPPYTAKPTDNTTVKRAHQRPRELQPQARALHAPNLIEIWQGCSVVNSKGSTRILGGLRREEGNIKRCSLLGS